jgi:hypothetical protein
MLISRAIGSLALVAVLTGVASADEPLAKELTQKEIDAQIAPVSADIRRCYLDVATTAGKIDVKLVVHRNGTLHSVDVAVTGVAGKLAKKISGCVRTLVAPLSFPTRRAFTTALVPFVFQKTTAPNSGPQHSCWTLRGCRTPTTPTKSSIASR